VRILHVKVSRADDVLIAQGLEEPGVLTQGKTLDELVVNVRDAASLLLGVKDIYIELVLPSDVRVGASRRPGSRSRRAVA
jgi:predicted RNase H-like HicB family nuclease